MPCYICKEPCKKGDHVFDFSGPAPDYESISAHSKCYRPYLYREIKESPFPKGTRFLDGATVIEYEDPVERFVNGWIC